MSDFIAIMVFKIFFYRFLLESKRGFIFFVTIISLLWNSPLFLLMIYQEANRLYLYDIIVIICFSYIQIRDFENSTEAQEDRKNEVEKLKHEQDAMMGSLLQWCYASYGEVFFWSDSFSFDWIAWSYIYIRCPPQVFSSWMHFCAVRIFTESIMRYGLPPSFLVSSILLESFSSVILFHIHIFYNFKFLFSKNNSGCCGISTIEKWEESSICTWKFLRRCK